MTTIDAKSKQATMGHMNREHSLDLGLYLRHVNGLSAKQLAAEGHPELVDIDLQSLYIRTANTGKVHVVQLTPPMAAWNDRRQRLIDLAMDARKAFGVPLPEHGGAPPAAASKTGASTQNVPFDPPGAFDLLVMFGVLLYFALAGLMYAGRDEATSNTWDKVMSSIGVTENNFIFGGADGFRLMLKLTFVPILAIHLAESWWMNHNRLAPRGMTILSKDGFLWTLLTFVIGFGSFIRFDRIARRQERLAAGAAKKH